MNFVEKEAKLDYVNFSLTGISSHPQALCGFVIPMIPVRTKILFPIEFFVIISIQVWRKLTIFQCCFTQKMYATISHFKKENIHAKSTHNKKTDL